LPPPQPAPERVEVPGLHNVYRVTDKLDSGSGPEGEEDFRSLQRLGIKIVLSVDGARPDLARARKYGLRYVHLPIGYDGVPGPQALRIAKAVRDLPGPVYLHCHHGKHRGPAAAAVAWRCLDEQCSAEAAVAWLRQAGTDPHYTGLYAAARDPHRPAPEELDRVSADFPEAAEVTALAQVMVVIDQRWEHIGQVRAAGWKPPPNNPDVDPPHEALQLAEQYREMGRLPQVTNRPEEFRRWLREAEQGAKELEAVLRQGKEKGAVDGAAAEHAFCEARAACTQCHARYRDVPQAP
jgi:protein tyrosine phosphatase (PTP) superfamily phosphohydrolase (DUF442 family)